MSEESTLDLNTANVAGSSPMPLADSRPNAKSRYQRQLERALNCVDTSLERVDPFEAILGAGTGNLMCVAAHLDEAILGRLRNGEPTVERLRNIAPSIDISLKVARQIDRQLQLLRTTSERKDE